METIGQPVAEITTVSSLVPLVHRLAGRFRRDQWAAQDREDIIQEGFIGLMEAAGRFEPERGCSLSTYGGKRAVGAMIDYVRTLCRRSRERTTEESPQDLIQYRSDRGDAEPPKSMESGVMLLRFRNFLGGDLGGLGFLDEDEREIIRLRFFEGRSCREAAETLGVSAATVCRVERTALVRLRKNFVLKFCGPAATGPDAQAIRAGRTDRTMEAGSDTEDETADDEPAPDFDDILASLAL